jgi:hypothetical protein
MIIKPLVRSPAPVGARSANSAADPYSADGYFTDGFDLYRLARWLRRTSEPPLAALEDCRTLHVTLLEREDLVELALRPVARDAGELR